jgi:hypothetical protein
MPLIRLKAITEAPILAGRRDSCLRSVPVSVKYIDLPENPELRSRHLIRSDRELSRGVHLPRNSPSSVPSHRHLPCCAFPLQSAASIIVCWNAGYCVRSLPCRSAPQNSGNSSALDLSALASNTPRRGFQYVLFLRGMEEAFSLSPYFGIPLLKRLSWMSKRHLPPSRDTFKPHARTIVKLHFLRNINGPVTRFGISSTFGSNDNEIHKLHTRPLDASPISIHILSHPDRTHSKNRHTKSLYLVFCVSAGKLPAPFRV